MNDMCTKLRRPATKMQMPGNGIAHCRTVEPMQEKSKKKVSIFLALQLAKDAFYDRNVEYRFEFRRFFYLILRLKNLEFNNFFLKFF